MTEDEMNGITDSMDMSLGKLQELAIYTEACYSPWGWKSRTRLSDFTHSLSQSIGASASTSVLPMNIQD